MPMDTIELKPAEMKLEDLTSRNPDMQRCLTLAVEAARSSLPILLLGESGTGKTLLARAIHNSSLRAKKAFVSFNASAMSDTLLESQLFGHEKGAFTGAAMAVRGKFETAHEGTLFFDEIADMSSLAQAKVLRAVEYGEFERLGAEVSRYADVRIISATNKSLRRLIQAGGFREDLYHRLNGISLLIPPLRRRTEDLPGLVAGEFHTVAAMYGKEISGIDPDAFAKLMTYHWPGNLRELHRVVQTATLFANDLVIHCDDIVFTEDYFEDELTQLPQRFEPTRSAQERAAASEPSLPEDPCLDQAIREHVSRVYRACAGNKSEAARLLKISRGRLDRIIGRE